MAWKGILFALRIVSRREVAVKMWEEPEVSEVKRKRRGSASHWERSWAVEEGVVIFGVVGEGR